VRAPPRAPVALPPPTGPHLAHPEACAALRTMLVTVPRVSRSRAHFQYGFDLDLRQRLSGSVSHRLSPSPRQRLSTSLTVLPEPLIEGGARAVVGGKLPA
jgi:hypothetical protein